MANEAFALSPISARASLPSESDYDAIREAFMETSRGRWFLSEYGKRNRNADTSMVLDAVARIEASLGAQKQPPKGVADATTAIRAVVGDARAAAASAMPSPNTEETVAAARKGARIVREVAWTLRECGADARICDLLDTQVKAIDAGYQTVAAGGARDAVLATFDLLMQRIEEIADGRDARPAPIAEAVLSLSEIAGDEDGIPAVSAVDQAIAANPRDEFAASISTETAPPDAVSDTDAAYDDAMLDLIAMEMAAADAEDLDVTEPAMVTPAPVDPEAVALEPVEEILAPELSPQPAMPFQLSLGATLIANGIVSNPSSSSADPLAPIRRMTQVEKIAFFS